MVYFIYILYYKNEIYLDVPTKEEAFDHLMRSIIKIALFPFTLFDNITVHFIKKIYNNIL